MIKFRERIIRFDPKEMTLSEWDCTGHVRHITIAYDESILLTFSRRGFDAQNTCDIRINDKSKPNFGSIVKIPCL